MDPTKDSCLNVDLLPVKTNMGIPNGLAFEMYCAVFPVLVMAIMPSASIDSAKDFRKRCWV